jgi:hypothetical protein
MEGGKIILSLEHEGGVVTEPAQVQKVYMTTIKTCLASNIGETLSWGELLGPGREALESR